MPLDPSTVTEADREQIISDYSDDYKDRHGFRPRIGHIQATMPLADLVAQFNALHETPLDPCDYSDEMDDTTDAMDGDAQSALASAGFGTDEDYGGYDDNSDF